MTQPQIDFEAIKARQRVTWASGDFARIGTTLQLVGETLCEAVDVHAGQRILDVAAGNGNASLAAARRGGEVIASDYVGALLEGARRRAWAEGLHLRIEVADAENLPFGDDEFDTVLSTFGVMFAPDHARSARELLRVTKPGGKIGLACWTPEGFIGQLFKVVGSFVPPPRGLSSPALWGTERHLVELFGGGVEIATEARNFDFRYRSADEFVEVFRDYYGPTHKAFEALPEDKRPEFHAAIADLAQRFNRAKDGTLAAVAQYLEIVITKPA